MYAVHRLNIFRMFFVIKPFEPRKRGASIAAGVAADGANQALLPVVNIIEGAVGAGGVGGDSVVRAVDVSVIGGGWQRNRRCLAIKPHPLNKLVTLGPSPERFYFVYNAVEVGFVHVFVTCHHSCSEL